MVEYESCSHALLRLGQILLSCCLAGDRHRHLLPAARARAVVSEGLADLFLANLLLRGYGILHDARRLFDGMLHRNLVSWSSAISMYAQHGADDEALLLFAAFRREVPNEFLLASVLRACTQSRIVPYDEQDIDVKLGLDVNVYVGTALVTRGFLHGCGDAAVLCPSCQESGYLDCGDHCTGYSKIGQGELALDLSRKADLETDEYVKNAVIDMYAKCDHLTAARAVFHALPHDDDAISYNAIIEGYARQGDLTEALDIFRKMRYCSLMPNLLTFVSLLGASSFQPAIELSKQIHGLVIKLGTSVDLFVGTVLIDAYSLVDDAKAVFLMMQNRDMAIWNSMIFGYVQNQQGEEAVKLFSQLRVSGVRLMSSHL